MLLNAALRWMSNFSHPGMDRIMQATCRRNIGRYRLATMRSCRQLHRRYTANSAGLIGNQNGAYRTSVVPVHRKKGDGRQQPNDVAFLRCQKSQHWAIGNGVLCRLSAARLRLRSGIINCDASLGLGSHFAFTIVRSNHTRPFPQPTLLDIALYAPIDLTAQRMILLQRLTASDVHSHNNRTPNIIKRQHA